MRNDQIIQASFNCVSHDNGFSSIESSRNGFVNSAINAYSNHHHLILRPDDVWLAVLTQFTLYINRNAEELRHKFVAHVGQLELEVRSDDVLETADFGHLASRMGLEIEKQVVDPDFRSWVIPDFSTTTSHDRVVASIVFMGSMKKYFTYLISLKCGLPSVTLLGEQSDWQKLYARLEKLPSLGPEAETWHSLLVPVFRHFVDTFDAPHSKNVKGFWQHIGHRNGGSGPTYYCGWITAFCFFDEDGTLNFKRFFAHEPLELDGVQYPAVDSDKIPSGYASVPVTVDDNGKKYHTVMVAGSVGWRVTSSEVNRATRDAKLDSLQPVSGWWIFERKTKETIVEDRRVKQQIEKKKRMEMMGKWARLGEKRLGESS